jgi:predicted transcriptional regulator
MQRECKGESEMLEPKEVYTLQDLFDNLPISLRELSKAAGINEVTLARIRDGSNTYRSTANKLLLTMSKIYDRPFYLNKNITGINVMVNKRLEKKAARQEEKEPSVA